MVIDYFRRGAWKIMGAILALHLIACDSPTKYDYSVDRYTSVLTPYKPRGFTNPNDPSRIFTLELKRTYWDQGRRVEATLTEKLATLEIGNAIELNVGTSPTIFDDAIETTGQQPWITIENIAGATTAQTSDDTLYTMFNMPHRLPRGLY